MFSILGGAFRARALAVLLVALAGVLSTEHAGAAEQRGPRVLAHTYTIGMELLVNGHSITETELVGLLYGRAGIPVIFASGDDRLAADLKTMPWLQYVTAEKARSASDAELYPVEQVHEAMRKQAKLAVQRLNSAVVMRPEGPLQIAVRAVPPANTRWLKAMPGVNYENETVSFTASDMAEGYRRIRPIVTALSFSFADAELAPFNSQPNADDQKFKGMEELYRRWFAAESGHAAAAPTASSRKSEYHGFE